MSAPQYAPQQQFPPQQPAQQPQYPAPVGQPAYQPQYPGVPAQGYPPQSIPQPQQPQQYGQPGYGWPQPQQTPPPQPLAQGSLDDFYSQPRSSGAFLKFEMVGQTHAGIVAHTPTKSDIRQVTTPPNQGNQPQFYRDGRPKLEMLVSLKMQATQENPDGIGIFPVKGADRDELARAMAEAGAPEGPPEAGAFMQITFTESRPVRGGGNNRKVKQIQYVRPEQVASAGVQQSSAPQPQQAPQQQAQQYVQQPPAQQYQQPAQQPVVDPAAAAVAQQFPGAQFAPQTPAQAVPPVQQPAQQAPVQQPAQQAAAVPGMPPGMTPQQQALLQQLGA